ncbi:MAG: hypothetical protein MHPSP_004374, partial [Paramarteilia canceri]
KEQVAYRKNIASIVRRVETLRLKENKYIQKLENLTQGEFDDEPYRDRVLERYQSELQSQLTAFKSRKESILNRRNHNKKMKREIISSKRIEIANYRKKIQDEKNGASQKISEESNLKKKNVKLARDEQEKLIEKEKHSARDKLKKSSIKINYLELVSYPKN